MSEQEPINIQPDSLRKGASALHQFSQALVPMGTRMEAAGQKLRQSAEEDTSGLGKALAEGTGGMTEALGVMFKQVGRWTGGAGLRLKGHADSSEQTDASVADALNGINPDSAEDSNAPTGGSGGTGGGHAQGGGEPGGSEPSGEGSLSDTEGQQSSETDTEDVTDCKDPVDVVSGMMFLPQTDVDLPGVLPLVIGRTFRSNYRQGRWFGRRWASFFDQRVEVDADAVHFADADGVILHFPLPEPGRSVLPDGGSRWPLSWDRANDLISITDPRAGWTYSFPASGGRVRPLRTLSDRNGHRIMVITDQYGVPTVVAHSAGYRVAIDTADTRDGLRISGLRLLDGTNNLQGTAIVSFGYDPFGNLVETVDSTGLPLIFEYDDRRRITKWRDRVGSEYEYEYDAADRVVRTGGTDGMLSGTMEYDEERRITYSTDSVGAVTAYHWDENDRVVKEVDPLGCTTLSAWDSYGNLVERTDAIGAVTRLSYDESGNPIEVIRPDGRIARTTYNRLCLPTRSEDVDGSVWQYTYDEAGNLLTQTDPLGAVTTYTYADGGRLASVTDALGHTSLIESNPAGLATRVTGPLGASDVARYDAFGRPVELVDPFGVTTTLSWTVEGRMTSRTVTGAGAGAASGDTETWAYDGQGNVTTHVDGLGQVTSTESGTFNLPRSRTTPDGARYEYEYDTETRLSAVVNATGQCWQYMYDAAGRLVSETDFDGRVLTYTLTPVSELASRTNGAGETVHFEWDELGRLTAQRVEGEVTRYAYDARGLMTSAQNGHNLVEYVHDPLGRVLRETVDGRAVEHTYDATGRRTQRVTPAGVVTAWSFDAVGNPLTCTGPRRAALSFEHDASGRETSRRIGTSAALTTGYDSLGRVWTQGVWAYSGPSAASPTAADASAADASAAAPYQCTRSREFTYRADGHATAINDQLTGQRHLQLDPLGRVLAVTGARNERYAYDPAGNLVQDGDGPRVVERARLRQTARAHYEYDNQGRVIRTLKRTLSGQRREWAYSWNAHDQLTEVVTPDGSRWRYTYDPLGRRIGKHLVDGEGAILERTVFTWDGTRLIEQARYDAGGVVLAEPAAGTPAEIKAGNPAGNAAEVTTWDYLPGGFDPVGQTEQRRLGPDTDQAEYDRRFYAIATDLVGRPTELIDEAGRIDWYERGDLWGLSSPEDGGRCPLSFPGQYRDAETGWHYNYFRYYDPETARYTAPDPLGLGAGPNHYAYVENPQHSVDPLGLAKTTKCAFAHAQDYAATIKGQEGVTSAAAVTWPGMKPKDKPFTGYNGEDPGEIHPVLQNIIDTKFPKGSKESWPITNCAEFVAVNKALKAGHEINDLSFSTVMVKSGTFYPPCQNCVVTTAGAKLVKPPRNRS